MAFLRAGAPDHQRDDEAVGARWLSAQGIVLRDLLEVGGREARRGTKPALVIDIHDTLQNIEALGLKKRHPDVAAAAGGPALVAAAVRRGMTVVLLSNSEERYRPVEIEELRRLGFPIDHRSVVMMLKPEAKADKWKDSDDWKSRAAEMIAAQGYLVLGHFDDKAKNLAAMAPSFPDSIPFELSLEGPHAKPGSSSAFAKLRDLRH